MAVINPPGFLQNAGATHNAEQLRDWHALLVTPARAANSLIPRGGVNPAMGFSLQVTQTGSPSMAVIVKSGTAAVPGTEGSKQGVYSVINDADLTLSIAAAHATLNRIDIVCFKVEDQAYSGSVNTSSLVVVTGTPAGSPTAPTAPNNSITLASVSIVANDTSITNNEITDLRQYLSATGGLISVATSTEEAALIPYESMGTYRRDLDAIRFYDGTAFRQYQPLYITRQTLGGTAASITFSSIPSNLKKLRISWTARSDVAGSISEVRMRVNNDATAQWEYEYNSNQGTGTSGSNEFTGQTSGFIGHCTGSTITAGKFGHGTVDWVGWDSPHSTWLGYLFAQTAKQVNNLYQAGGGWYAAAGPYTRLDFFPNGGVNFIAGTDFQLEGSYT